MHVKLFWRVRTTDERREIGREGGIDVREEYVLVAHVRALLVERCNAL